MKSAVSTSRSSRVGKCTQNFVLIPLYTETTQRQCSTAEFDRMGYRSSFKRPQNPFNKKMDFVDIPVSLASRLTDDDVGAVLVCIDAIKILKRLNLTHCFNVVGHGFEPLRSSTVLEKLDLGLYRILNHHFGVVVGRLTFGK